MASTSSNEYKEIKVTRPISVECVSGVADGRSWNILIMGPTGSGKSTLIESLGLMDVERISSNRLEGFTQTVSTYILNGVTCAGFPVYVVDSPGFADTKISGMAILSMLKKWMEDNGGVQFSRILYVTPITQVRLSGSQRQVLRTFQALTGVKSAKDITMVTSMWDLIWGEQAEIRAQERYTQLEGGIWKEFLDQGAQMVKSVNTQDSTLSILDNALNARSLEYFNMERKNTPFQKSPFAEDLYKDLQDRIQNLRLEIPNIRSDLTYAETQGDNLLVSVLLPRLEEAEMYLTKFQKELQDFGPPPPGLHPAHSNAKIPPLTIDIGYQQVAPAPNVPSKASSHGIPQPGRGRLSRARDIIMSCGSCTKGVEANHDM